MEYLDKIKEAYPLPNGYSWGYHYQQHRTNPYDGWDILKVVDKSGHEVGNNVIHGVRDYFQWTRTAQEIQEKIAEKLEDERFRKEMMNPTSKIEDLGEARSYEYVKPIEPKKRSWWL